MNERVKIICDFDGTISARDVGHHFFELFVPHSERRKRLLNNWKAGMVSSKECLEKEVEWVEAGVEELDDFIDNEKLDPYFKDFVDFCNRRKYDFLILSDGLDYYIDRILMDSGLGYLDFEANHLVMNNGDIIGVEFPGFNTLDCTLCGNCKKYYVEEAKKKGFLTVYVGNGYSDVCPSRFAHIILAKGDLMAHCQEEERDFIPFANFRDVERELTSRLILPG